jgi:hypothetical protein
MVPEAERRTDGERTTEEVDAASAAERPRWSFHRTVIRSRP